MVMSSVLVRAVDYVAKNDTVVQSAERCAAIVVEALREQSATVLMSFRDMPGIPSSYYNVLLKAAVDAVGADEVRTRMVFDLDSGRQRFVFLRSWTAVVGDGSPALAS
jgi:hypothetical protein